MSGLHLGDLNESVDVLQKENFDLKMQLFYLKQKAIDDSNNDSIIDNHKIPSSPSSSSSSSNKYNNMNDSQYASRRLSDLETELQIMKMNNLKIERELAAEKSMISTTNKSLSLSSISARALTASLVIEENRNMEREAVLAIAEHDAAIINKLENEVQTLKLQHEMDIAVINECADRSNDLIRENNEKTSILIEQQEQQLRLQQQIDYLSMQFKRQELLIERTYGQKIDEITVNKDINSSPLSFSWISKQNNTLVGSPGSNIAPPVISKKDIYGSPGSLLSSVKQPMTPPSAQRINNSIAGSTQKDFLDFGAQAAYEELHSLRKENTSLKEQLERERKLMKNQEAALNAVKQAAEEISLLEAEEISRLEAELERCTEERDKWMKRATESNDKASLLRQRLFNLDNSRMEDETKGLCMEVEHAFYRSKSLNQSRISLNDSRSSITTLKPQIDIYKHREDMWKQREDMYKQREKELLIALEGVVLRCSELERQIFLLQKQRKHHK